LLQKLRLSYSNYRKANQNSQEPVCVSSVEVDKQMDI
jgi:hypothetical protein